MNIFVSFTPKDYDLAKDVITDLRLRGHTVDSDSNNPFDYYDELTDSKREFDITEYAEWFSSHEVFLYLVTENLDIGNEKEGVRNHLVNRPRNKPAIVIQFDNISIPPEMSEIKSVKVCQSPISKALIIIAEHLNELEQSIKNNERDDNAMGLQKPSSPNIIINNNNQSSAIASSSASVSITLEQTIKQIEEIPESELSKNQKDEIKTLLTELSNSDVQKDRKTFWSKAKPILAKAADKGFELAKIALPYVLKLMMEIPS